MTAVAPLENRFAVAVVFVRCSFIIRLGTIRRGDWFWKSSRSRVYVFKFVLFHCKRLFESFGEMVVGDWTGWPCAAQKSRLAS